MIDIHISNLDTVVSKCLQIAGAFDGAEKEIADRWTEALDAVCRPACPVDTGYMLSCLHAEVQDGKLKGFWYGIKDTDCDYAKFVEYAWGGRSAWFNKSVDSVNPQLAQIFHDVCMERLERVL